MDIQLVISLCIAIGLTGFVVGLVYASHDLWPAFKQLRKAADDFIWEIRPGTGIITDKLLPSYDALRSAVQNAWKIGD